IYARRSRRGWRCRSCRPGIPAEGTRRIRAPGGCRASCRVLVEHVIPVDLVRAAVLALQIMIKPEVLFPADDGQGGIECVQVGNLDVLVVLVIPVGVSERDAL